MVLGLHQGQTRLRRRIGLRVSGISLTSFLCLYIQTRCLQNNNANIVPLWEKYTLTIREAARYFHIGEKKLRQIVDENPLADFIVMNGNRTMIKRKIFEKYMDDATTV